MLRAEALDLVSELDDVLPADDIELVGELQCRGLLNAAHDQLILHCIVPKLPPLDTHTMHLLPST